jgi:branched-subunit amino acid permease
MLTFIIIVYLFIFWVGMICDSVGDMINPVRTVLIDGENI